MLAVRAGARIPHIPDVASGGGSTVYYNDFGDPMGNKFGGLLTAAPTDPGPPYGGTRGAVLVTVMQTAASIAYTGPPRNPDDFDVYNIRIVGACDVSFPFPGTPQWAADAVYIPNGNIIHDICGVFWIVGYS